MKFVVARFIGRFSVERSGLKKCRPINRATTKPKARRPLSGAKQTPAAQTVYEDRDLSGIKVLIDWEDPCGQTRMDAALKIVADENPDNPLRSMGYLIGTIKNGETP